MKQVCFHVLGIVLALSLAGGEVGSASASSLDSHAESEPDLFQLDGDLFVAFYDLPSRRFRAVREAFLTREFAAAAEDLRIGAQYLDIERQRAYPTIASELCEVIQRMAVISDAIDQPNVTVRQLDPLFARSHWLLAQHFLYRGVISRSQGRYRPASRYLTATVHHMERAALWSNARLTPQLERAVDELRSLANRLETNPSKRWVNEKRPLLRANKTLNELGAHIDMQVGLPDLEGLPAHEGKIGQCTQIRTGS